tara:strand:+ start:15057 stop:15290 length:234 start_codon:yes stop_codon:yes gene_type:complete
MSDLTLSTVNEDLKNQTAAAEATLRQSLSTVDENSQASLTQLQFDIGQFTRLSEIRSNILTVFATLLKTIITNLKSA